MCVLMLAVLTGCASSGAKNKMDPFNPRPIPGDIKVCLREKSPAPKRGNMSAAYVMSFIAHQKLLEEKKIRCGNRLINLYEAL